MTLSTNGREDRISQRFCSAAAGAAAAAATMVLLLSVSLLGGFHHLQTAVVADHAKRETAADQSQANSVFGCGQPVKQQRLPASLSCFFLFLSFSFFVSCRRLMRFYLAVCPTSFNKWPFAAAAAAKDSFHCSPNQFYI